MRLFAILFAIILTINGCSSINYANPATIKDKLKQSKLETLLKNLGSNREDSKELAEVAITYSKVLANRYNLASPPLYHNFLVNSGQRDRGLCFHFVEDLMEEINRRGLSSFDFKWGRANANMLDEHNVVVVVKKGSSNFKNGVILDSWRKSGDLYFILVKDDPKYNFKEWQEGNAKIAF